MLEVTFHQVNKIPDGKYQFAVVMARQGDAWLFVRHKERTTWEIPGGHREKNETIGETAARELYEETGAAAKLLVPVSAYSVSSGSETTYGVLFYAETGPCGPLPDMEIAEVKCLDAMPENLTYPEIQPALFEAGRKFAAAWSHTMYELSVME
jgi:8-oxo-dGTP diphosphatase